MTPSKPFDDQSMTVGACKDLHRTRSKWVIAILGFVFVIACAAFGFAFGANREMGEHSVKIEKVEERVVKLEMMDDKLDKILAELRRKQP